MQKINKRKSDIKADQPSIKIGWLAHLFGCWHKKMGNPFTRGSETYCACRECGACRKFDIDHWKCIGPFFYNSIQTLYETPVLIESDTQSQVVSAIDLGR